MENYHLAGCDMVTNLEPKQMGVDEEENRDHMANHELEIQNPHPHVGDADSVVIISTPVSPIIDLSLNPLDLNMLPTEEEDNGQPGDHVAMHVLENNHHSLHIHSPQVISLSSNNHLERRDLKEKLEKATKQAESVDEAYAKKAINAQASGKKAIYEAVASTTNCFKICIENFVVSLGINGEDKSLEDHVTKLVKAIPFDARAPADMAVEVPGQEGDVG
ncbi:hypothetical protein DCAR_0623892 [Daucus carota subsp. sativus]|uniref:Uncharacterized protein n=1 Tax=Daucus carota subsp. sativus TaxID=79200 RepID=A0AAF0XAU7_DAUCS|nr:hypothetical protein DCAR_0623892 [Daucus carota subsp. sativus]